METFNVIPEEANVTGIPEDEEEEASEEIFNGAGLGPKTKTSINQHIRFRFAERPEGDMYSFPLYAVSDKHTSMTLKAEIWPCIFNSTSLISECFDVRKSRLYSPSNVLQIRILRDN